MRQAAPTLYLVDGTYSVFRSYFALPRMNSPAGAPTQAVFGLLATVRKLLRERTPHYLGVAFDLEGPTHRDAMFADYKAHRPAPPADLIPQFPLAMEACRLLGWPVLSAAGFEADDVLATLAFQGRARGFEVVLVTADKDLFQLVGQGISVLRLTDEALMLDPAGVEAFFGVRPEQVGDVLALMGDASDNIPGVPGVGEKTAKGLIRRYGTLEAVLARAGLFAGLWSAREESLAALESGASGTLQETLPRLVPAASRLAALEEEAGGEEARELVSRFRQAADLHPASSARQMRKALKDLESKTQPKVWNALAAHQQAARFSRQLVEIRTDAPVTLDLEAMKPGVPDRARALDLFRELGFRQLIAELEAGPAEAPRAVGPAGRLGDAMQVRVVDSAAGLREILPLLEGARLVALDTETDGLDPRRSRLVGISLAVDEGGGFYLPVGHRGAARQIPWPDARDLLGPVLASTKVFKTGQNLKFDRAVLRQAGIEVEGIVFDSLLAAQLLDPGRGASHRLDDLAVRYLGAPLIPYEEVAGGGRTLDLVPVEQVARYAVEDAVAALRLTGVLGEELRRHDLLELLETIEAPLVPVLEEMEARGVRIDCDLLAGMSARMEGQLAALERECHALAGRPFNINSPPQLRVLLFEELKLQPTGRRTEKTREHSTGSETLEALAGVHPLPAKILEYRELAKLKSTYVDALPRLVDPRDGRVHTVFHQLGAATGRLSSSDPNLQNIPVRTPSGREIRRAFVPEPGWVLLSADYSQMELRVLAHLAGDEALQQAFREGHDIHRYTAALVAGIPPDRVTPSLRAQAKAVNFGIIYGMSEFRLARDQGVSRAEARDFIEAYFRRYPKVKEYIEQVTGEVQKSGEVRTLFGRIRRFPELLAPEKSPGGLTRPQRETLLRQAVNATVQGTAADIVKRAMILLHGRLRSRGLASRLLLQVHDELLLEVPPEERDTVPGLVVEAMAGAASLEIPLTVEVGLGESWAEVH